MVAKLLAQRSTRSSVTVSSRVSDDVHRSFVRTNDPAASTLGMYETLGNQAMQRLLRSGAIQTKLAVGQPGDPYEQEADRVADQVLRMPEPAAPEGVTAPASGEEPLIQRMCTECEVEEEATTLQAKAAPGRTPDAGSAVQAHALQGGGQPLPHSVRNFFEPRFDHDFSQVRIHADTRSAESAKMMNARAYTLGRDIVFGSGQYGPMTAEGQRLLAHELTHVMQQGGKTTDVIQPWFTRNRLPYDYEFAGQGRRVNAGLAHEDITEHTLRNPDFAARFYFGTGGRDRLVNRSGHLDVLKEEKREQMRAGRITEEEFHRWEVYNHGFTREAGERQKRFYVDWAATLANEEGDLGEALNKVGDALHVAQDMNAHLFIPPGCSPWTNGCSEAQDDPGINPRGFGHAFVDTWIVLETFYRRLTPRSQAALSTF